MKTVFSALALLFFAIAAQAQNPCKYELRVGTLAYALCDTYDTVPRYDAHGEIIDDTVAVNPVTNAYHRTDLASLQKANDMRIVKSDGTAMSLRNANISVTKGGTTKRYAVSSEKLDAKLIEELSTLQEKDRVVIESIGFNDGSQSVKIPAKLTLAAYR